MPELKYLYRDLYILINCFFKQIVDILLYKAYYQESYILIIEYSSVVIVAVFNYLESDTNATAGYVFYKWCLHFDMEIVVVLLLILVFNRFTHIFEFCALRELEIRIQHSVPNYW
jgi:hypothetical protein